MTNKELVMQFHPSARCIRRGKGKGVVFNIYEHSQRRSYNRRCIGSSTKDEADAWFKVAEPYLQRIVEAFQL